MEFTEGSAAEWVEGLGFYRSTSSLNVRRSMLDGEFTLSLSKGGFFSVLCLLSSALQYRASSIEHPVSSIQYRVSALCPPPSVANLNTRYLSSPIAVAHPVFTRLFGTHKLQCPKVHPQTNKNLLSQSLNS